MGIEHVTWALRRVRGIDTAAKMVLISLSNFADAAGLCWPSVSTICADTGLSEATVKRRLADLVKLGAMTKHERAGEGKRQKSNIYALDIAWMGPPEPEAGISGRKLHGVILDEIGIVGEAEDIADGVHGEPHHGAQAEPDGALCEPHRGLTVSPPLSLNRQFDPSGKEEEARALETIFQKIVKIANPGPTESLQRGRLALGALSADEIEQAVKHAPGFFAAIDAERRKRPSIATYLTERRWEAVARQATMRPSERTGGRVFVRRDSDVWDLWAKHLGKDPRTLPTLHSREYGCLGWYFGTTLYPPKRDGEAA
jgi:hypothetical protein